MTTTLFNPQLEAAAISCVFKNPITYTISGDIISKDSFAWKPFTFIWTAIENVVNNDLIPDVNTVSAELGRLGWLDSITIFSVPDVRAKDILIHLRDLEDVNVENAETYAIQVERFKALRDLADLGTFIRDNITAATDPDEILAKLDFKSGQIASKIGSGSRHIRDSADVVEQNLIDLRDVASGKKQIIKTHIDAWDNVTRGLFPGRLYVIAGYSGDGKSTLALDTAFNISIDPNNQNREKTFFVTLEMSAEEVNLRLVQRLTGIESLRIENADLTEEEFERCQEAFSILENSRGKLFFDDSPGITLPVLRTKIRKAVSEGAKLVIIDQLEQITVSGMTASDSSRLNWISYRLKEYAREMQVPIILLHQMNRSSDNADARKQGKAAYDVNSTGLSQAGEKPADVIIMIRHEKDANEKILRSYFKFVKHRQGQKVVVEVVFNVKNLNFEPLSNSSANHPDWLVEEEDEFGI